MDKSVRLTNSKLVDYCEPVCAILENIQIFEDELHSLCEKNKIVLKIIHN